MTTFSTIDIARTGVGFAHYWMDVVAHNVANVNTVNPGGEEPFRARLVVAQTLGGQISSTGSGVVVADVVEDPTAPAQTIDPTHPLADEDGVVTLPVVDLAGQMSDMLLANRTYQANLRSIENAREAYAAALRIGQQ